MGSDRHISTKYGRKADKTKVFNFVWIAILVTAVAAQIFDIDEEAQLPKQVPCSTQYDLLINERTLASRCQIQPVYMALSGPTSYEAIYPGTLWVNRCVGDCLHSEYPSYICRPAKIVRRDARVHLYNVKTKKHYCTKFQVEEHVSCHCDDPNSTCSSEPIYSPGLLYFPQLKRCVAQYPHCSQRQASCAPEIVSLKKVYMEDKITLIAEEHDTCHCRHDFIACSPKETYIDLPTNYEVSPPRSWGRTVVKMCSGNCHNANFTCFPTMLSWRWYQFKPDVGFKLADHVDCVCGYRMYNDTPVDQLHFEPLDD
ncbi:uncharacterized protein LOC135073040 [Ostrinia nubilalis]|uniref:uncharacterized protein LOC135073040 n=1 Tax=Ostrinia nubilalis TaxID=29057 RepID=UPI00308251D1